MEKYNDATHMECVVYSNLIKNLREIIVRSENLSSNNLNDVLLTNDNVNNQNFDDPFDSVGDKNNSKKNNKKNKNNKNNFGTNNDDEVNYETITINKNFASETNDDLEPGKFII
jgi:hypothetical protein